MVSPTHTGALLLPLGGTGFLRIMILALAGDEVPQLGTVTVTEYVPAFKLLTDDILGFCVVLLKPFGPVHS
jgi:hypothetical protein